MTAVAEAAPQKVAHTTFDSDYIAWEVARRYAHKGEVRAQLLYRGYNDVYIIEDENGRRALRVWRAGARSLPAVAQELDFLEFLRDHKVPVSSPLPTLKDERHFILNAAEGDRPAVLYTWAPGRKFGDRLDVATAEKIGGILAELHLLAKDYRPQQDVPIDISERVRNGLPAVLPWLEDRPDDVRDYTLLAERLPPRIDKLAALNLPRGMCHQDLHASNVHIAADGTITLLDFDGCALGYWLYDVKNYVFASEFFGHAPVYSQAFERGYARVRPMTADEIANGELILMTKAFRLLTGAAGVTRSRGRDILRLRPLDWFADYIKPRARILSLL